MKLARISLPDSEQTEPLFETLRRHGIAVTCMSPTELVVACDGAEHVQQILADANAFEVMPETACDESATREEPQQHLREENFPLECQADLPPAQDESILSYDETPLEREFILAPYWRSIVDKFHGAVPDTTQFRTVTRERAMQVAASLGRLLNKLHEAEERILHRGGPDFIDLLKEEMPQRESSVPPPRANWIASLNAPQAAGIGALAMAALMMIGIAVTHHPVLPPQTGASLVANAPVSEPGNATSALPVSAITARQTKPSPVADRPQSAKAASANRARRQDQGDREVVTHYYPANRPKVQRASYSGVQKYSDLN